MTASQARALWITSDSRSLIEAAVKSFILAAVQARGLNGAAAWIASDGASALVTHLEAVLRKPVEVTTDVAEIIDRR